MCPYKYLCSSTEGLTRVKVEGVEVDVIGGLVNESLVTCIDDAPDLLLELGRYAGDVLGLRKEVIEV